MTNNIATEHTAGPEGRAERREMEDTMLAGSRRWRRKLLAGAVVGGAALLFASVSWACTLRIGTLKVCRTGVSTNCSQVTGSGAQTGMTEVDDDSSSVTVTGEDFLPNVTYTVTLRKPTSGANCHRVNTDGSVVSLIGNDSNGNPNRVTGPDFSATGSTPDYNNGSSTLTGLARVCAQDINVTIADGTVAEQTVVTGNVLDIEVVTTV